MGVGPRTALRDPDLGFNLSVMRAAEQSRDVDFEVAAGDLADNDPFLLGRLLLVLQDVLRS